MCRGEEITKDKVISAAIFITSHKSVKATKLPQQDWKLNTLRDPYIPSSIGETQSHLPRFTPPAIQSDQDTHAHTNANVKPDIGRWNRLMCISNSAATRQALHDCCRSNTNECRTSVGLSVCVGRTSWDSGLYPKLLLPLRGCLPLRRLLRVE